MTALEVVALVVGVPACVVIINIYVAIWREVGR